MKQTKPVIEESLNLLKWFCLTLLGIVLYMVGSRQAFHQRGYEAIGGEIFLILLPFIYWPIEGMVKEIHSSIKEVEKS